MATRAATPISATPEAVNTVLGTIPFNAREATAKGLLPCLVRSMGHILFALGSLHHPTEHLTPEELQNELDHAAGHLDASTIIALNTLSRPAKDHLLAYCTAVGHVKDSLAGWGPDDQKSVLRSLADRAAGLAAFLDRECFGVTSDPGTSL